MEEKLLQKETPTNDSEREMYKDKDYEHLIVEAMNRGKKEHDGNFYIIVNTEYECNYFTTRSSCPTPEWDQTVYFIDRQTDKIVFLWTIPSNYFKRGSVLIMK